MSLYLEVEMKILVVGSINVDFVTFIDKTPKKGETIIGNDFKIGPGGKGANQAIAAKKLGGEVAFFGKVGSDYLANVALENFVRFGIAREYIRTSTSNTGVANIIVKNGDNSIIVIPGANHDIDKTDFDLSLLDDFDIIMLQQELNIDFVYWLMEEAYKRNKIIIFDPAPYNKFFTKEIIRMTTYLTPNEIEAIQIFGENYEEAIKRYPNKVILTKGKSGAVYYDGKEYVEINAKKVDAIDTTGAGDVFNGALAVAVSEGKNLYEAVSFAVKAATKSVEKRGAQEAIPSRFELD